MKRILISPLDWGLGHATRCIPLIRHLCENGVEVMLGGNGRSGLLLKEEFPGLPFIEIPGYDIRYPADGSMALKMLFSVPRILTGIRTENKILDRLISEHHIDAVISDNRYGLYSARIPSVFISHQLFIQAPVLGNFLSRIQSRYICRFRECWIPDTAAAGNLSGRLSHSKDTLLFPCRFLGPLSRFEGMQPASPHSKVVIVLSGPEPQRTLLENIIMEQIPFSKTEFILIRGVPGSGDVTVKGNVQIHSFMKAKVLHEILSGARALIGRPGYSTIMDAAVLGKKCFFIATPGQTEQKYLAAYHSAQKHCVTQAQEKFDISSGLAELANISGFNITGSVPEKWKECLEDWLKKLK